jgi:hypothetical protein
MGISTTFLQNNPENQDAKTSKGPIPRSFWISDYKEKQFAGKRKIEDY